uniref:uncharacterized protein LOC120347970 n=1 Tax=Styela clava TaxID=7725 RepID=UPI00193A6C88|nr:uncharacterized protein LOC120347970 [Styela clava]
MNTKSIHLNMSFYVLLSFAMLVQSNGTPLNQIFRLIPTESSNFPAYENKIDSNDRDVSNTNQKENIVSPGVDIIGIRNMASDFTSVHKSQLTSNLSKIKRRSISTTPTSRRIYRSRRLSAPFVIRKLRRKSPRSVNSLDLPLHLLSGLMDAEEADSNGRAALNNWELLNSIG